jgi:hypothetical protein
VKISLIAKDRDNICPLCKDELSDDTIKCRGCGTVSHAECMDDMGGCPTMGCDFRGKSSIYNYAMGCRDCSSLINQKHEKNCPRRGIWFGQVVSLKDLPEMGGQK